MLDLIGNEYASVVVITLITNLFSIISIIITNKTTGKKLDDEIISTLSTKLDELDSKSSQNELDVKRLELQTAIDRDYGKQAVSKVFDEYELLGGNSYMHDRYDKYMSGDLSN